jgi:hypothetical protein
MLYMEEYDKASELHNKIISFKIILAYNGSWIFMYCISHPATETSDTVASLYLNCAYSDALSC